LRHDDIAASADGAVALASLTNIVGFGSPMLSSHRGIFSLGFVVAVGVVCLWVASVTTLPSLLALLGRSRPTDRVPHQALSLALVPAVPEEGLGR
jgi:predicted RND superfamily exporter protein